MLDNRTSMKKDNIITFIRPLTCAELQNIFICIISLNLSTSCEINPFYPCLLMLKKLNKRLGSNLRSHNLTSHSDFIHNTLSMVHFSYMFVCSEKKQKTWYVWIITDIGAIQIEAFALNGWCMLLETLLHQYLGQ